MLELAFRRARASQCSMQPSPDTQPPDQPQDSPPRSQRRPYQTPRSAESISSQVTLTPNVPAARCNPADQAFVFKRAFEQLRRDFVVRDITINSYGGVNGVSGSLPNEHFSVEFLRETVILRRAPEQDASPERSHDRQRSRSPQGAGRTGPPASWINDGSPMAAPASALAMLNTPRATQRDRSPSQNLNPGFDT